LKASEALLADGNAKLSAALLAKDMQRLQLPKQSLRPVRKSVRLQENNLRPLNLTKRVLKVNENS